ncbi:hypothetical protein EON79_19440 [bacterium]|nr:MAG: hypothetical protein EON79_19440 [bacterium]
MFRKPDQDLFARIFDEGQTGDAGMEWLRDGLKDLRDVPVHGLSNERLRDRVLGTGLAPVKASPVPWWTWAWAPVAAAAIAVVILPRLRSNPAPTIILNPETSVAMNDRFTRSSVPEPQGFGSAQVASAEDFDIETTLAEAARLPDVVTPSSSSSLVDSSTTSAPSAPRATSTPRVASTPRSPSPRPRTPGATFRVAATSLHAFGSGAPEAPVAAEDAVLTRRMASPTLQTMKSAPSGERASREMMALTSETSDPLVVLAPDIDATTGAAAATEVDSPANLSIGG